MGYCLVLFTLNSNAIRFKPIKIDLPDEEKRAMIKLYYPNYNNSVIASDTCFQQYPEKRKPHKTLFTELDRNIALYGSFRKTRRRYEDRSNNYVNEEIFKQKINSDF